MTSSQIPNGTWVVVASGGEARVFRNQTQSNENKLELLQTLGPKNLANEGPSGVRPPESSPRETDEATFAKQLAEFLYQRAHAGEYDHLVLVVDPDTLGELRPQLHKEVTEKIVAEIAKTLVNSSPQEIEETLASAVG